MNRSYESKSKAVPKWPVSIAAIAILLATASAATAGIANTKHNLTNSDNNAYTTSIEQICAFCHTPHGADASAPVPLWNKDLSEATYTTYASLGTTTLDSEQAEIGSVSLACLSCHDGTQALDVMINAPGSGWGVGDGTPTEQGYSFVGSNKFGTGNLTGVSFIDTDLQNDHPISIQYGGGGITDDVPANPTVDEDFATPIYATIGGSRVWWIETPVGTTGKRDKTDLPLYTRENAYSGQSFAEPFVECASCHNPHSENVTFLRTPDVADAQLCQHCHTL